MSNACTTPAATVAERPLTVTAAPAAVETEAAQRRRQGNAIGFDPLPEPFDAGARVRFVTASGKVTMKNPPWANTCTDPYRLTMSDPVVYREWHDRFVGPVVDIHGRGDKFHVTACAMKDRGGCVGCPPDTLAVFVSTNSTPPFTTVLFTDGFLGLAHLIGTMKPLLR